MSLKLNSQMLFSNALGFWLNVFALKFMFICSQFRALPVSYILSLEVGTCRRSIVAQSSPLQSFIPDCNKSSVRFVGTHVSFKSHCVFPLCLPGRPFLPFALSHCTISNRNISTHAHTALELSYNLLQSHKRLVLDSINFPSQIPFYQALLFVLKTYCFRFSP
jgi:hypothetical protein